MCVCVCASLLVYNVLQHGNMQLGYSRWLGAPANWIAGFVRCCCLPLLWVLCAEVWFTLCWSAVCLVLECGLPCAGVLFALCLSAVCPVPECVKCMRSKVKRVIGSVFVLNLDVYWMIVLF